MKNTNIIQKFRDNAHNEELRRLISSIAQDSWESGITALIRKQSMEQIHLSRLKEINNILKTDYETDKLFEAVIAFYIESLHSS